MPDPCPTPPPPLPFHQRQAQITIYLPSPAFLFCKAFLRNCAQRLLHLFKVHCSVLPLRRIIGSRRVAFILSTNFAQLFSYNTKAHLFYNHPLDPQQMAIAAPQPVSAQMLPDYVFPRSRLRLSQNDPSRIPLVLVACGSFSPITYLHLRMFEMAADFAKFNTKFEILGGYLSPVSDAYKKAGLASSVHRLRMCELAVEQMSNWLMVDSYEAINPEYMPTALVLDHFEQEINGVLGGAERPDGTRVPVKIALLAGADLIQTMSTPGVWSEKDLDHILGRFGVFVVERTGTDVDQALGNLYPYLHNIYVIQQLIQNDVSSTKIRLFLRRGMSVQYLIPGPVIEYIEQNGLYGDDNALSADGKGKSNGTNDSGRESPAVGSSASKS